MKRISIGIIEDDPVVQKSLRSYLGANPRFEISFAVNSIEAFQALAHQDSPSAADIVLLDIQLPGMSGLEGIRVIKRQLPPVDIIMLTTFEEADKIFKALCAGACSYLSKQVPLQKIQEAILTVSQGGAYMSPKIARKVVDYFKPKPVKKEAVLTARQQQIVDGLLRGLSYKMVAAELNITLDTVRAHVKNIYRVLEINSKAELIKRAYDQDS
ncbi:MAG: response regulator transcription factor [Cyanothece sp. SIO1E1]|nr:response regulator transcription factor [Cyanothece sp. SIO1E1]